MKKTLIIAAFAAITLAISITTLLAHRAAANAPDRKAFVGAWERIYASTNEGVPIEGPNVRSHIVFSAEGHFAQASNPAGREKLDKPMKEMTKEELLNRFEFIQSSYGDYSIGGNVLTRKQISNANPNSEGKDFSQRFRFEGDLLILNSTTTKSEVRFRRLK
jgi:hypothetical protein